MTHLLARLMLVAPAAFAVNGADDSAVIPPGPPVARPVYAPPPPNLAPAAGTPTQKVYQLPIDTPPPPAPLPTSDESDSPSSSSSNNPMSSLMPMLQGMGGGGGGGGGGARSGDDRAAGSGDSGGAQTASAGSSNALDIKGGAGQKNGEAMATVNGCAAGAGKFQLIYGDAKATCSPGRDGALKMSETLSSFLDRNLNRCVSVAAGTTVSGGKLFHAGVIGDARHKQTGSLHNAGLAIDVNAIEANGKTYVYADASAKGFFSKLRDCWGKAAQTERLGCLQNGAKGTPPGSVGDEDSDHTQHLHLSVPPCPADARSKGLYLAWWTAWWSSAHAAEPAKIRIERVALPGGRRAELVIRDQHGEPVDADHRFTVRVRCDAGVVHEPARDLGGCEFVSFALIRGALELRYLTSEMSGGELICRKLVIKRIGAACPPSN